MNVSNKEYSKMVERASPNSKMWLNMLKAFLIGGIICLIGQGIFELFKAVGVSEDDVGTCVSVSLVFFSAVLTGTGLYPKIAKHGGAGRRIETGIYPEAGDVVITIRDFGPGIPPEELPNVKYKFYKGSSTARGSGIGLAVCEEIVSRHNGELIIRNADDERGGCVAEIRLPTGT